MAENIVEPYEVTNSDGFKKAEDDQDVRLDPQLKANMERNPDEVTNSDEVRQPWDGHSFGLDPQL